MQVLVYVNINRNCGRLSKIVLIYSINNEKSYKRITICNSMANTLHLGLYLIEKNVNLLIFYQSVNLFLQ
jgi:hypothetical protein